MGFSSAQESWFIGQAPKTLSLAISFGVAVVGARPCPRIKEPSRCSARRLTPTWAWPRGPTPAWRWSGRRCPIAAANGFNAPGLETATGFGNMVGREPMEVPLFAGAVEVPRSPSADGHGGSRGRVRPSSSVVTVSVVLGSGRVGRSNAAITGSLAAAVTPLGVTVACFRLYRRGRDATVVTLPTGPSVPIPEQRPGYLAPMEPDLLGAERRADVTAAGSTIGSEVAELRAISGLVAIAPAHVIATGRTVPESRPVGATQRRVGPTAFRDDAGNY